MSLIPNDFVASTVIQDAVLGFANAWLEGEAVSLAVDDMLFRRTPRVRGHVGGALLNPGCDFLQGVTQLVMNRPGFSGDSVI